MSILLRAIIDRKYIKIYFIIFLTLFALTLFRVPKVYAAYDGSRLIDNQIFLDANAMNAATIQQFLVEQGAGIAIRSFVLSCGAPNDTVTMQAYAAVNAPCGQTVPASTIIYYASQIYGVNPRVVLATMQKEQSLTTAPNPTDRQIAQAMGYGCPTTGNCSDTSNFFYQIDNGTWVLRYHYEHANGNITWWSTDSFTCGNATQFYSTGLYPGNTVTFKDEAGVPYRTLTITNAATSAFYCYTPHTYNNHINGAPNSLNPVGVRCYNDTIHPEYGTTGYCYTGSFNFVYWYEKWFGSTTSGEYFWSLVRDVRDGKMYLSTTYALHYIPNLDTLANWGLDTLTVSEPSSSYFSGRTEGSPVSRLLRDNHGNLFIVDNKVKHYVSDGRLLSNLGIDINSAITVAGYVSNLTDGRWATVCIRNTSDDRYWVVDGGVRFEAISEDVKNAWGCNFIASTDFGSFILNNITQSSQPAQRFVRNAANAEFMVDTLSLWKATDSSLLGSYQSGTQIYNTISNSLASLLPTKNLSHFAVDTTNGQWYMIDTGKKYYIPNIATAEVWGLNVTYTLSTLSSATLNTLVNGGVLSNAAQGGTPLKYYLLDGNKRNYIPDQVSVDEWLLPSTNIPVVSASLLNKYIEGVNLITPIAQTSNGKKYLVQSGQKKQITNQALTSWGHAYIPINSQADNFIKTVGDIGPVAKDGINYFALIDGKKFSVPTYLTTSWDLNNASSVLSQTLARYPLQAVSMKQFVSINGTVYSLQKLSKLALDTNLTSLISTTDIVTVTTDIFTSSSTSTSYILRSTDNADFRLWLVGTRGKILLSGVASALNLGYISRSVELTILSPESLSAIPTDAVQSSLIISSPSGAMKLLSFGKVYTLPNTDIALAYINVSGSVMPVSKTIFDSFPITSDYATRLMRDDSGKIFWLDNGTKRWVLNGSLLNSVFVGVKQTYLHSTVMVQIPDGPPIN